MNQRADGFAYLKFPSRWPGLLALAATLALAACGGGGGGGGGTPNNRPTASFTATPTSGTVPLVVNVNAAASSDSDGTITSYAWTFGDSSSGTGVSTTHTYTTSGNFTITLTVTDNGGKKGTATQTIAVSANRIPTASFITTPTSGTVPFVVSVNAAASSDPDGSIATYAWDFGDNSSDSGVSTNHTYTTGGNHTITLTVTDNGGQTATSMQAIVASLDPPVPSVTVSGNIKYERVPFYPLPRTGLNYPGTTADPARGIVVELLKADQSFLATTTTDPSGNYSFAAPLNTSVFVRARAQILSLGSPVQPATWDVRVRNNTNSNALYVMDSATFNTGVANQTRNLLADSGWPDFGATSYTGPRVAAPFAIIDSLYTAVKFVVTQGGDSSITLPPLNVFWSPLNKSSDNWAPATGNIQSTQYRSDEPAGIYVQGKEDVDTDEYDEHVLTHEFQHYLGDAISRDDTVGGPHSLGEKLDARVAFSEGYANAFSAMSLNDPDYRDSSGDNQGDDTSFDMESTSVGTKGWFNESTLGMLAWDLFDSAADAADTVTIPYASILTVFRNQLRTGQPLTSIFPLIVALKGQPGAPVAQINALVAAGGMVAANMDAFATTETNDGSITDALPLYTNIALNGGPVRVCGNHDAGTFNALGNRRFLKFSLASTVNATIHAHYTATGSEQVSNAPNPDPDIVLFKGPLLAIAEGTTANQEDLVQTLDAGDYVIEVYEYSHIEPPATGSPRGRTCMNVTITG